MARIATVTVSDIQKTQYYHRKSNPVIWCWLCGEFCLESILIKMWLRIAHFPLILVFCVCLPLVSAKISDTRLCADPKCEGKVFPETNHRNYRIKSIVALRQNDSHWKSPNLSRLSLSSPISHPPAHASSFQCPSAKP